MAINVRKREGENANSLLYRFSKRVQQSGLIREVRKRRFHARTSNKGRRRVAALYREGKQREFEELKKYGHHR